MNQQLMPTARNRGPGANIAPPGVATSTHVVSPIARQHKVNNNHSDNSTASTRHAGGEETLGIRENGSALFSTSAAAAAAAGKEQSDVAVVTCVPSGDDGSREDETVLASTAHEPLDPSLAVDPVLLYRNLWLFIWLKAIGSYDSGAFSAAIGAENGISDSWGLSYMQQGTLTSSVFLGNIIGCPLAGHLFTQYSEKHVLNGSLAVHMGFTFLFATFPSYYVALLNRFFIGLSLAFIVVYTPVWVDEFAPKGRQSVWMASHNAGVPLGIMLGYLVAFFFPTHTSVSWEWAFYFKCVLMVPTIIYVAKVDRRSLNAGGRKKSAEDGEALPREPSQLQQQQQQQQGTTPTTNAIELESSTTVVAVPASATEATAVFRRLRDRLRGRWAAVWVATKPLLMNPVYMCSVLAMSSLYFVATGLQNYVTQYLLDAPFNASPNTLMAGFGASVVSAPVCGVIAGGILLDRFGGYKGNLLRVSLFALAWGTVAAAFSIICVFVDTTFTFLLVMSVVLFCGGAIIPPGAGLTMASLPDHLRSFGAAFSQLTYNTLGNFSGPMVCGFVADKTGKLKYGIMTLLLSSGLGLIPMSIILCVALKQAKQLSPTAGDGSGRPSAGGGGRATDVLITEIEEDGDSAGGGHGQPGSGADRDEYGLDDDNEEGVEMRPMTGGYARSRSNNNNNAGGPATEAMQRESATVQQRQQQQVTRAQDIVKNDDDDDNEDVDEGHGVGALNRQGSSTLTGHLEGSLSALSHPDDGEEHGKEKRAHQGQIEDTRLLGRQRAALDGNDDVTSTSELLPSHRDALRYSTTAATATTTSTSRGASFMATDSFFTLAAASNANRKGAVHHNDEHKHMEEHAEARTTHEETPAITATSTPIAAAEDYEGTPNGRGVAGTWSGSMQYAEWRSPSSEICSPEALGHTPLDSPLSEPSTYSVCVDVSPREEPVPRTCSSRPTSAMHSCKHASTTVAVAFSLPDLGEAHHIPATLLAPTSTVSATTMRTPTATPSATQRWVEPPPLSPATGPLSQSQTQRSAAPPLANVRVQHQQLVKARQFRSQANFSSAPHNDIIIINNKQQQQQQPSSPGLRTALHQLQQKHLGEPGVSKSGTVQSIATPLGSRSHSALVVEDSESVLRYEADAANSMSIPTQHMFGLDLVRTWLHSQAKEPARGKLTPLNASFATGHGTPTAFAKNRE